MKKYSYINSLMAAQWLNWREIAAAVDLFAVMATIFYVIADLRECLLRCWSDQVKVGRGS